MIFENESAQVRIDLDHGARVASLRVEGLELLVTESADPLGWGAYPMAPWTGRLRQGRFEYQAQSFQLPLSLPPHAIHGTVHDQRWEEDGTHGARCELDGPWPFRGEVRQEFRLEEDALCLRLEVHARDEPFPAAAGWHPWFTRQLERGEPAQFLFSPGSMCARDEEGISTGEEVEVPEGPWDDCFVGVQSAPTLIWPGALRLRLLSEVSHWVVYSEPDHAICIEPMTGPPNALNLEPTEVRPGQPLVADLRIQWEAVAGLQA